MYGRGNGKWLEGRDKLDEPKYHNQYKHLAHAPHDIIFKHILTADGNIFLIFVDCQEETIQLTFSDAVNADALYSTSNFAAPPERALAVL